jgi:hypothetical protein
LTNLKKGIKQNCDHYFFIFLFHRYELEQDKFWPGYMLDKLVMYEPGSSGYSGGWRQDGLTCMFQFTRLGARPGNLGKVKDTGPVTMPDGRFMHGGVDQMRTHFQKSDKAKLL